MKSYSQKTNAVLPYACDSVIDYNESHLFLSYHIIPSHTAYIQCKRGVIIQMRGILNGDRNKILFVLWCWRGQETLQGFAHSDPSVSCSHGLYWCIWSLQCDLWNGLWWQLWMTAWVNVQHAALKRECLQGMMRWSCNILMHEGLVTPGFS